MDRGEAVWIVDTIQQLRAENKELRELIDGAIKVLAHHGHDVLSESYQRALTSIGMQPPPTIDDVPSCGSENDYRRAVQKAGSK